MEKMLRVLVVTGISLAVSFGCSSKNVPVSGTTPENEKVILEQLVEDISPDDIIPELPDSLKALKYGDDSSKTMIMYSLYIEYFKQESYKDALKYWRYLFQHAPVFNKGIYVNGAKMYYSLAKKNKKDPELLKAYSDTLMTVYDQRIKYFDQVGYVTAEKGKSLFLLNPGNYIQAYEYLGKGIELDSTAVQSTTPYYYMYCSSLMFKSKKNDVDQFLADFQNSIDICETNINAGNNVAKWKKIIDNILQLVGPTLPSETLLPFVDEKFELVKSDPEKLKLYLEIMDMKNLYTEDVYLKYSEEYLKHDPSAAGYWQNGNAYYGKQRYSDAVSRFAKACELLTDEDNATKAKYYMSLAEAYRKSGNYPSARSNALKALEYTPDDGTPYMFIGGLYTASSKTCGSTTFEQKAVYWLAADMYSKAAAKGSEGAASAAANLKSHFPTKEEAFYQDPPVIEGQSYTIGCWINASTTVRFVE